MKKFVLTVLLIYFVLHHIVGYFLSEDFQKYGDEQKSTWTCYVNSFFGSFYMTMSKYQEAYRMYQPIVKRCSESEIGGLAEFRIAQCYEGMRRRWDAVTAYEAYAEKYKNSDRARIAAQAANALKLGA
ncbi:MAG: hypothetical protein LHV69_07235 [Elusimicrobia bacterium]|nr:hypothetical protein [Candidatus Obscuribacterium magneticum]